MDKATVVSARVGKAQAPSMVQLGRRVLFAFGIVSLALVAFWLWFSWNNIKQTQLQRMGVASSLVAGHAQNYFDYIGSRLDKLAYQLIEEDALDKPTQALETLNDFKLANADLGGATIILPNGQMFASTALKPGARLPNVLENPEWRADFNANLQARGLSVDRPQFGYLLQKWLIPLRFTVRDRDDNVLFLIQTSILIERQQGLWSGLALQEQGAIGLMREDGYLISRLPESSPKKMYGRPFVSSIMYQAAVAKPAGFYEGASVEGGFRYGTYQRLQHYPLYAFISFPRSTFLSMWWQSVRAPLYLMVGVLVASVIAYAVYTRRFAGRMEAIQGFLRGIDRKGHSNLPSSGVREIDTLCEALADSREQLERAAHNREKMLLEAADAGTYVIRVCDGRVVTANETFSAMLGMGLDELQDKPWSELLVEGGIVDAVPLLPVDQMSRKVLQFRHGDGRLLWISLSEYEEGSGDQRYRYGLAIDVTQRERLLATVRTQSERLKALWQLAVTRDKTETEKVSMMLRLGMETLHMDVAVVTELVENEFHVRHAIDVKGNFAVGQRFDRDDTLCTGVLEEEAGVFVGDLSQHPDWRDHAIVTQLGLHVYCGVPIWVGEKLYGTLVFWRRDPVPGRIGEDDRAFMELLASWFGQTLFLQQQHLVLENLAMTDSLTRLPNRRAAETRFTEELARSRRQVEPFAVAICDLDRFKLINDHYGHDVGDEVLREVAILMKSHLREGDWVARWGGEEFIVFLHSADSGEAFSAMERMRAAIKEHPVQTRLGLLDITASIGVGVQRGVESDIARILSEADGCLYEAKQRGRDCVVVSETARRSTLWKAGMLQRALLEGRVTPAYQVIVELASGEVVADEALARLIEVDGATIAAGEFIEAAEGINLVHIVDQTITRKAMERCAVNITGGKAKSSLAHFVNLSPQFLARKELVDGLIAEASAFCTSCNMDPQGTKPVVFEITERQLVGDMAQLVKDLRPLLDFGFRLALDDFGSGYSSFLYLAELPVSFLKIEGWMVRNMRTNPRVLSMVQSVVLLAQKQGIITIAECIEDQETAVLLRDMGVDWGQGYYFGRPRLDS
jgi:diguanylate cyclase (GGDEF)-like protein/PAS domain S-box-containing protein